MSSNISEEDSHIPDYDNVRSDLFNEIFARHGMASFQLYWSSFRRFIIGQLSKEEFDIVVKNVLSEDKGTYLARLGQAFVFRKFYKISAFR